MISRGWCFRNSWSKVPIFETKNHVDVHLFFARKDDWASLLMLGWCFFFYSLGARIPKWASTIPIQNFTDRKESKAAQPLPPTINCRLGDKSTYTTWAPPKKNVTFNYTRCLRAMVHYNPYIRWVVWLSLPTWKGRFQVVRLPFPKIIWWNK